MQQVPHGLDFQPTPFKARRWNPLDYLVQPVTEKVEANLEELHQMASRMVEISERFDLPNPSPGSKGDVRGMEVGDDRVDACQQPKRLALMLVAQESTLRMKTSWKDTYISQTDWNFCEVTSQVPAGRYESFDYARKTSLNFLGFTDAPTLRTVIDVSKGDRSHSSTAVGKAKLLGGRGTTPRTENLPTMMLASWLQDGFLNTPKSPEPKYLHRIFGGSGAPPLWGDPVNTYLYVRAYKGGSASRVYGTAINEARTCVRQLDVGAPAVALLCSRLRDKEEYLHATYAQSVLMAPLSFKESEDMPRPLYEAAEGTAFIQGMENRLLQSKRVLTRLQAEVEWMRSARIQSAILGYEGVLEAERQEALRLSALRDRFDGAFYARSAVQNLLNRRADGGEVERLVSEGFLNIGTLVQDISLEDVYWMCRGGKGEAFTIDDITSSSDMFLREEVSLEETLKVGGIPLRPVYNSRSPRLQTTRAKVGLWQISETQEEWADTICSELVQLRAERETPLHTQDILPVFERHREWVSDDSLLVKKVLDDTAGRPRQAVALVSADRRLARVIAQTTGNHVVLVNPVDVLARTASREWSDQTRMTVPELTDLIGVRVSSAGHVTDPYDVYIDTGSVSACAMRMDRGSSPGVGPTGSVYKVKPLRMEYTTSGRVEVLEKEKLKVPPYVRATIIAANTEERVALVGTELGADAPASRGLVGRTTDMVRRYRKRVTGR